MKRSTSKKDGQQKPEDGTQQKISSFFQPGQAQSKLFTSVTKKSKPPLCLNRQSSTSKPDTTTTVIHSEQKSHSNSGSRSSMTVLKDFNSSAPQHGTPEKSPCGDMSDPGSPECIIIPDTPDSKPLKSWPKPVSRSFLCPVAQLCTMPGKKPSQPKPKKVVKKSLGLVSVEFGKKRLSDDEKVEGKTKENSVFMGVGVSDCSADASLTSCSASNSRTDMVGLEMHMNASDFNPESGYSSSCTEPQGSNTVLQSADQHTVQSSTPTKTCSDRNSVKRMAVQGLSPNPKRTVGDVALMTDSNPDSKPSTCQRKVKAKRQLASLTGFKDVREMNQSVNHYQLGGSSKTVTKTDASCTKDDVLADILGEMADTTALQQKKSEKKRSDPISQKRAGLITGDSAVKAESVKIGSSVDTSEDEVLKEILGELDNKLGPNLNTGLPQHKTKIPQHSTKIPQHSTKIPQQSTSLRQQETKLLNQTSDCVTKDSIKSHVPHSADDKPAVSEPCKLSPDRNTARKGEPNSGKQASCDVTLCDITPQATGGTPTKLRRKHLSVEVEDPVDSELASSLGQLSPFKNRRSARSSSQIPEEPESCLKFTDRWNRYVVQGVDTDRTSHDKVLTLSKEGTSEVTRTARLQGFWSDTHVEPGDIVHLLLWGQGQYWGQSDDNGNDDDEGLMIVDDHQGQIIVNPDLLLSGTTIVSGVYCLRRSVLNEKFKGIDSKNVHMLYGSIIHSLFQEVLKDRLTSTEEIMAVAKSIVKSNKFLHDMYGQNVTEAKVLEEIEAYVGPLQTWLGNHVPSVRGRTLPHREAGDISVVQIHDIEETIWSPRIGVKGKIDMTVEVEMGKAGARKRKVLPLELKTGKASYSVEHKGQVTLYSMMMCDRRENPGEGLLLYLKHNDMDTVPVRPENTRGLLQLRNEMAYYLSRQVKTSRGEGGEVVHQLGCLPSPINSQRSCSKCPQLVNCALYQRSVENLQHPPDHAMSSLVPEALSHLSDSHLSYVRHWLLCLDLEAAAQHAHSLRNIWCMSSADREEQGDCLRQLVMVTSMLGVPETQAFSEGKGCCVQLQRKPGFCGGALNMGGLAKNDVVVISSEDGRYIALSTGFIRDITENVVDVVVDRDSFHENTAFQWLVLRIDRCDTFNTAGYLMSNLSRLLDNSPHCHKLRSLIIDGRKPEFQLTMSKSAVEKVKRIFRPLNKPQKTAILKVLMSKDYLLIKGYPGTGKTSTIVALVKILRELGQTVLLTSYTHSAVDNILLKLKRDGVPFLRLGRSSRIHPSLQDHSAERLTLGITSVDHLRDFYSSYGVVATSCLGVTHPVFTQRRFDVCIVDEASQVLQPACLGPLFHADRFVLVGDPQQLPPVVQSRDASSLGMAESLFVRLDGAGATFDLHLQYRMNSTIMQLSNELVYDGALMSGDHAVSTACIQPPHLSSGVEEGWVSRAMDTSLHNAVVFLDTRQVSAPERCDSKGFTNDTEARVILHLCSTFVQAGISASDIGVIAPYRAQVRALQQLLWNSLPLKGVEVNTVDQYQGRDKSVVFISFVRSNLQGLSDSSGRGGLLQDARRLNVAVTRAKHKLVLVGHAPSLHRYLPLDRLLSALLARDQIFPLPADLRLEEAMDM
ncbi:DNA replication ATP-dependent helicase/nuclease DNA2-like [Babylonia areolata]|uniref:DNA replication ATP-dependent helicase/nuclease DNA2-like n=1 Tax=Babylonia areolata TaxID=304850 RepID=UPI003FD2F03C